MKIKIYIKMCEVMEKGGLNEFILLESCFWTLHTYTCLCTQTDHRFLKNARSSVIMDMIKPGVLYSQPLLPRHGERTHMCAFAQGYHGRALSVFGTPTILTCFCPQWGSNQEPSVPQPRPPTERATHDLIIKCNFTKVIWNDLQPH